MLTSKIALTFFAFALCASSVFAGGGGGIGSGYKLDDSSIKSLHDSLMEKNQELLG